MSHAPHEPLTPEERALADRLAQLGPHGGPSPALDARILAAAHAAVAQPPQHRRWWALTGVPASLVTGAGMAAALALVVGVVWQLRPSTPPLQAPREKSADMGYISAEVIERPRPTAPPPPLQTAPAPAPALRAPSPAQPRAKPAAPPSTRQAVVAPAAEAARDAVAAEPALDEAVIDAPAPAAPAGYSKRSAATAASAPPSPPAPVAAEAASAVMASPPAAEPAADTTAMAHRETRAAAEAAPALDRIEVTGSRIRASDLPVQDDTRLAPTDWLERIRARRDAGELDEARASLVLFRRAHPHTRLPDDLRPLLVAPR
ncbi:hypothetical protein ACFOLC_15720 [Lysobacter cavernae]|uniref:Uncharacterized protein n=1 Tax=Lysobacter cavernae TaxID=1685901 RepID=A0ABV7RUQ7_9GAMM